MCCASGAGKRGQGTNFVAVLAHRPADEVVVLPLKHDQADNGIVAIGQVVGDVELEQDEGVYAAPPGLAAVHAGALLAIRLLLVLYSTLADCTRLEETARRRGQTHNCDFIGGCECYELQ